MNGKEDTKMNVFCPLTDKPGILVIKNSLIVLSF